MDEQRSDLLDRARGLAAAKALVERAVADLIDEATTASVDVSALARALGLHRSSIYRLRERSNVEHT